MGVIDRQDGDTISRHDAINALWKALFEYEDKTEKQFQETDDLDIGEWMVHRIFVQNMSDIDRQTILNLPSSEPVRKKGKWIFHETENDRYDDMICPFCKTSYTVDAYRIDDIGFTAEDFNFCPNCGASMSEGEESHEDIPEGSL